MKYLKNTIIFLFLLFLLEGCSIGKSLTNEKVQRTLDKALDYTKVGGNVEVLGVQETPEQNIAIVDIRFDKFRYNADQFGTPIGKDKKSPPPPSVSSPNFSEGMLNSINGMVHVESYSGKGAATLKHYNDGRWVMTEINFNYMRISPNLEVQ